MSPKTPRNISGKHLVKALSKAGYQVVRLNGSHIRLTRLSEEGSQNITIPNHDPIKLGTLNAILIDVSLQLKINKEELMRLITD